MHLEIELGVTGGEEDGVDNTDVDSSRLYTQPEEVAGLPNLERHFPKFHDCSGFGNVHGVYKPNSIELQLASLTIAKSTLRPLLGLEINPWNLCFMEAAAQT